MVLPGLFEDNGAGRVVVQHTKLATSLLHFSEISCGSVDRNALQNGNIFAIGECLKV